MERGWHCRKYRAADPAAACAKPLSLFAYLYTILGDKDRAFAWLEKAYQQKTHGMPFLKEDPIWDEIRSDPRFSDLERRVGVP